MKTNKKSVEGFFKRFFKNRIKAIKNLSYKDLYSKRIGNTNKRRISKGRIFQTSVTLLPIAYGGYRAIAFPENGTINNSPDMSAMEYASNQQYVETPKKESTTFLGVKNDSKDTSEEVPKSDGTQTTKEENTDSEETTESENKSEKEEPSLWDLDEDTNVITLNYPIKVDTILNKFNISLDELKRLNPGLEENSYLFEGDKLNLKVRTNDATNFESRKKDVLTYFRPYSIDNNDIADYGFVKIKL